MCDDQERLSIHVRHIFHGEINAHGRAVGFHHCSSIGHVAHARVVQVIDGPNAQGIYRARVEIRDPTTGRWVNKGQPSTFFPDRWSRARVLAEIKEAFRQRYFTRGRYWEGRSPSGVRIGSYLDHVGAITTAFPIF